MQRRKTAIVNQSTIVTRKNYTNENLPNSFVDYNASHVDPLGNMTHSTAVLPSRINNKVIYTTQIRQGHKSETA